MELKYILMVLTYQALGVVDEKYVDFIMRYEDITRLTLGEINEIIVSDFDLWVRIGG